MVHTSRSIKRFLCVLLTINFCFAYHTNGQETSSFKSILNSFDKANQPNLSSNQNLSSTATEVWRKTYGSGLLPGHDGGTSSTVDDDGYLYVTGYSQGEGGHYNFLTFKYDPSGHKIWSTRYEGAGNGDNFARVILYNQTGYFYIMGESTGAEGNFDYVLIKYNKDGQEQWIARYNGTGNGNDYPTDMTIDSLGNIYITGKSKGLSTGMDIVTIKYSYNGILLWQARFTSDGEFDDDGRAISLDSKDNIFVAGVKRQNGKNKGVVLKYNLEGNLVWSRSFLERFNDISSDDSGNVYAIGTYTLPNWSWKYGPGDRIGVIKYSTEGEELWSIKHTKLEWGNFITEIGQENLCIMGKYERGFIAFLYNFLDKYEILIESIFFLCYYLFKSVIYSINC